MFAFIAVCVMVFSLVASLIVYCVVKIGSDADDAMMREEQEEWRT